MSCKNCKGFGELPAVIPVLERDECSGCYVRTKCILLGEEVELLELEEGTTLESLLIDLINRVKELEEILENN